MGSVTGLTAERMQEIIDETIVGGSIVGNNMILTKHNGSTIDLGQVVGVQGVAPFARVKKSAVQSAANGVETAISFNVEDSDNNNIHDTVTNNTRLVCRTAGIYLVQGVVGWASNATGVREASIKLNNTTYLSLDDRPTTALSSIQLASTITQLAVNDYLELIGWQNSGGALNIGNSYTHFEMVRIGSL